MRGQVTCAQLWQGAIFNQGFRRFWAVFHPVLWRAQEGPGPAVARGFQICLPLDGDAEIQVGVLAGETVPRKRARLASVAVWFPVGTAPGKMACMSLALSISTGASGGPARILWMSVRNIRWWRSRAEARMVNGMKPVGTMASWRRPLGLAV